MKKRSGLNLRVQIDAAGAGVFSQAGAVVPVETARATGLDRELSRSLGRWRRPSARHDPGLATVDPLQFSSIRVLLVDTESTQVDESISPWCGTTGSSA